MSYYPPPPPPPPQPHLRITSSLEPPVLHDVPIIVTAEDKKMKKKLKLNKYHYQRHGEFKSLLTPQSSTAHHHSLHTKISSNSSSSRLYQSHPSLRQTSSPPTTPTSRSPPLSFDHRYNQKQHLPSPDSTLDDHLSTSYPPLDTRRHEHQNHQQERQRISPALLTDHHGQQYQHRESRIASHKTSPTLHREQQQHHDQDIYQRANRHNRQQDRLSPPPTSSSPIQQHIGAPTPHQSYEGTNKSATTEIETDISTISTTNEKPHTIKVKIEEIEEEEEINNNDKPSVVIESGRPTVVESPERLQDIAARLLYHTVRWARSVPAFTELSTVDQIKLLENSWSDIFTLFAFQWHLTINSDEIVKSIESRSKANVGSDVVCKSNVISSSSNMDVIIAELEMLESLSKKFKSFGVSEDEFIFLKSVVLFKPGINICCYSFVVIYLFRIVSLFY